MCHYTFYTKGLKDEIEVKLAELIKENEINGQLEVNSEKQIYEVSYETAENLEQSEEYLAHVLSDIVQKQAIIKVCNHYLKSRDDLSLMERREVADAFLRNNYLSRQEGFSYITYYLLYLPIYKEIKERRTLNIEGWLQFRIGKYKILLNDVLEQFIEDYMAKKEVVNFIRLMRDASLLAIPLEEEIHVIYKSDGKINLYNKQYKNVTGHYIKKYCKELLLDSTLTREDLLLHVLITVCPKKVFVHKMENMKTKQFMNTLEIIFEENIIYCQGCEFCRGSE